MVVDFRPCFSIDRKNGRPDEVSFDLYVEPGVAGAPVVAGP